MVLEQAVETHLGVAAEGKAALVRSQQCFSK
jgi:hypothetical protein